MIFLVNVIFEQSLTLQKSSPDCQFDQQGKTEQLLKKTSQKTNNQQSEIRVRAHSVDELDF